MGFGLRQRFKITYVDGEGKVLGEEIVWFLSREMAEAHAKNKSEEFLRHVVPLIEESS